MTGEQGEWLAGLVVRRISELENQLRFQTELSQPCPSGGWRWADVKPDGVTRKNEEELAADRGRAAGKVLELRAELETARAVLAELLTS